MGSFVLLMAIATFCLLASAAVLIGLTSAPWPVLLLLLVLVLVTSQRLLSQVQWVDLASSNLADLDAVPPQPKTATRAAETRGTDSGATANGSTTASPLLYRGAKYETGCADVVVLESDHSLGGKYRGCNWQKPPSEQPGVAPSPSVEMTYRGAKIVKPTNDGTTNS